MPRRRSDQGGLVPPDAQSLFSMLDEVSPIGDIKSWGELVQNPSAMNGLFAVAGLIPGVPARRLKRDWQDLPLKSSNKTTKKDMSKRFLDEHSFKELDVNEAPMPDTYRILDNGKIQAFSGIGGKNGKVELSSKTFDEGTSLKTLRNWMGY